MIIVSFQQLYVRHVYEGMFILESSIPNIMNNIYSSERSLDAEEEQCEDEGKSVLNCELCK